MSDNFSSVYLQNDNEDKCQTSATDETDSRRITLQWCDVDFNKQRDSHSLLVGKCTTF